MNVHMGEEGKIVLGVDSSEISGGGGLRAIINPDHTCVSMVY